MRERLGNRGERRENKENNFKFLKEVQAVSMWGRVGYVYVSVCVCRGGGLRHDVNVH